jgi:hypothetical protein
MLEKSVSEAAIVNENSVPNMTSVATAEMPSIHRTQLAQFLRSLHGRFVGVDFVKQDGCARALNGRLGVHKHCVGGENKTVADSRPYITIFDVKASGYRTLNLATATQLRANGLAYSIVG